MFFIRKYTSTIAPSAILYIPKALKLCFFTKLIRNSITISDTAKETAIPINSSTISNGDAVNPARMNFSTFSKDAPSITGIARKKENSADAVRDTPVSIPPRMVAPEREVPGISDKT